MTHPWQRVRAKAAKHAALMRRLPELRAALYGQNVEAATAYERDLQPPDPKAATRETAQKDERQWPPHSK